MLVLGTCIVWSKGLYPTVPTPGVAFCVILCDLFLLQRLELLPPWNPVLFNLGQATRKWEILLQAAKADMSSKEKLWLFVKRGKLMQDSVACDCLRLSWYSTVLHIHLLNAWLAEPTLKQCSKLQQMCIGCSQEHVDSEGDRLKASNIVHVAVSIEDIRHLKSFKRV